MLFGSIFQTLIVKPIFNLLVVIYSLLPGHNFGVALIIFTIIIRMLLWPVVKRQLHQARAMRKLQPELKRIKKAANGNRQQESVMLMELYKERGIKPFASIGTLVIQLIVLIGLYEGLRKVVANPQAIIDYAYPWVQNLSWMKELAANIGKFDATFLGFIDLTRPAIGQGSGIYWPAMMLVIGSAIVQYLQTKQLMPNDKDARSLRAILKAANSGDKADQSEVNAAVGRSTRYFIPVMIFFFTVGLPAALSLYWFVSGLTAFAQQAFILRRDEEEMEKLADAPDKKANNVIEGEVVEKPAPKPKPKNRKTKRPNTKAKKGKRK